MPVIALSNVIEHAWRRQVSKQVLGKQQGLEWADFEPLIEDPADQLNAPDRGQSDLLPAKAGLTQDAFRAGENVQNWITRVADEIASITDTDPASIRDALVKLAQYKKPVPGERVREFTSRVSDWLGSLDRSLDVGSTASAIALHEPVANWIERTAPLYLTVGEGESVEEVIPALIEIAKRTPPRPEESALAWVTRVQPSIAAYNNGE